MNIGDERSMSCWMQDAPAIEASPLQSDQTCDVVVIGSGIAGLSTAYEMSRFGRSVIVIDRGRIGCGMTARTTAHLATELDDFYSELIRVRGDDEAGLYYDSQVAAVNRIEAICREEGIDADFARVDGFLFPAEEAIAQILKRNMRPAGRSTSMSIGWIARPSPESIRVRRCGSPTRAGSIRRNTSPDLPERSSPAAVGSTRTRLMSPTTRLTIASKLALNRDV
jgi:hypothetical protein